MSGCVSSQGLVHSGLVLELDADSPVGSQGEIACYIAANLQSPAAKGCSHAPHSNPHILESSYQREILLQLLKLDQTFAQCDSTAEPVMPLVSNRPFWHSRFRHLISSKATCCSTLPCGVADLKRAETLRTTHCHVMLMSNTGSG